MVVIFIAFRYLYNLYNQDLYIKFKSDEITLEYDDSFIAENYVDSHSEGNNIMLIYPSFVIDKLGEYVVTYQISNGLKSIKQDLKVKIVDNTKPGFSTLDEDKERDYNEMKDNVIAEVKKIFKPEFINRIDDIIVFHKLTRDEISKILDLNIKEIKKITKENIQIDFKIDKSAKELILENGYKDEFGARELKRTLTSMLTDLIAEEKLKGNIHSGDSLVIVAKNKKLVIKKEDE